MRTQEEILQRVKDTRDDDFFGFRAEILVPALTLENANPWLKEGVTEWTAEHPTEEDARKYLEFAFGKALGHRGISAGRSVQKLEEFAWFLKPEALEAMNEAGYAQYGVPKLCAFATAMGFPIPDSPEIENMRHGRSCEEGCESGCGQ